MIRLIGHHYEPSVSALSHMTGGSLAEWFDCIIHHQQVTPTGSVQKRSRN